MAFVENKEVFGVDTLANALARSFRASSERKSHLNVIPAASIRLVSGVPNSLSKSRVACVKSTTSAKTNRN